MKMERLRKFLNLSSSERWLLVKVAFLLGTIRLGLWLLPFRTLRRLLTGLTAAPARLQETGLSEASRIVRAVEMVGWHLPGIGTCLTQALTAQALLARRGYPTLLHIGVVRGREKRLEAHAWLESRGEVLIGGSEIERYAPLVTLEEERP